MTSPEPIDGEASDMEKVLSPYVFNIEVVELKAIVRRIDPGAVVVAGARTIGGAGGALVEVEDKD